MVRSKFPMISIVVTVLLASVAYGQRARTTLYVWNFAPKIPRLESLTERLTGEFEEALIKSNCYQVLERTRFDRLARQAANEKMVQSMNDLSSESKQELRVARAQVVVFGTVDHDVESGEYKISVSLQRFDSTKMLADSVRVQQGKINDAESREKAMSELVKKLCPTGNAVVGPETLGAFYYLNDNGQLAPMERKTAQYKAVPSKSIAEVAGERSPVRLKTGTPSFVVRPAAGANPGVYQLIRLTARNGVRIVDMLQVKLIPCNVTNYGKSSHQITPADQLPPGEYALGTSSSQEGFLFGIDGDGKTIASPQDAQDEKQEILINTAQAYGASSLAFVSIIVSGIDDLGGTDVKVLINGQDVTANIKMLSGVSIALQASAKALNLKNGENEVTVKAGKLSSRPYKFRMGL